jgi:hypothetical protein
MIVLVCLLIILVIMVKVENCYMKWSLAWIEHVSRLMKNGHIVSDALIMVDVFLR